MTSIEDLDIKIKALQERKKKKLAAEREKARKARNHRLIEIGAMVESCTCEIKDMQAFESYLKKYSAAIRNTQPKETEKAEIKDND